MGIHCRPSQMVWCRSRTWGRRPARSVGSTRQSAGGPAQAASCPGGGWRRAGSGRCAGTGRWSGRTARPPTVRAPSSRSREQERSGWRWSGWGRRVACETAGAVWSRLGSFQLANPPAVILDGTATSHGRIRIPKRSLDRAVRAGHLAASGKRRAKAGDEGGSPGGQWEGQRLVLQDGHAGVVQRWGGQLVHDAVADDDAPPGARSQQRSTSCGRAARMAARRATLGRWLIGWLVASMSQNPSACRRRSTTCLSVSWTPGCWPYRPCATPRYRLSRLTVGHRRTGAAPSQGRVGIRRPTGPRADPAGTAGGAAHTMPSRAIAPGEFVGPGGWARHRPRAAGRDRSGQPPWQPGLGRWQCGRQPDSGAARRPGRRPVQPAGTCR
jgi:hypothetical protein